MGARRNVAFGFFVSLALHGAALAAALAFGSGWWGDARPVVGSAAPAVWPVVWIDPTTEPPTPSRDVAEPSPEPIRETASTERAAPAPEPDPSSTPAKAASKPQVHLPPAKKKPEPVADQGPDAATVAEAAAAETSEPAPQTEAEKTETSRAMSGDGADATGLELAALPPPAPAPSASGWSVEARVPPIYPLSARRRGIEGKVVLRAEIGADGTPSVVRVIRGSGHPELDTAARAAVEKWRFRAPTGSGVEIPIVFQLENR